MDRFARQFGARVKQARIDRGFTQSELASAAAVGANYVPRIERGEMTPSVDSAFRLAQALGVSLDDLCAQGAKRDPVNDAARTLAAVTDGELAVFKRAVSALEAVRGTLRHKPAKDGKPVAKKKK